MTSPLSDNIEPQAVDSRAGKRHSLFGRLIRKPAGAISLSVLVLVVLVGVFAPWLSPFDPNFVDLSITRAAPSADHWLGGDTTAAMSPAD